jgi:predicted outer membrane protein
LNQNQQSKRTNRQYVWSLFEICKEKTMSGIKYAAVLVAVSVASVATAQVTQQTQRDPSATGQNQSRAADTNQSGQRTSQPQSGQVGQAGRLGASGQSTDMDSFIASCLLIGNQEEVALAQLAVDQAESDQVKQFAQMLIEDHQKAIQKLQPLAKPGIGLNEASQSASAGQSRAGQSSQQSGAQQYTANRPSLDRGAGNSATADQILQLDQEAAQECLQMTKSMLQEKQGAEFDKAFAGMQVGMHVGMLAKLKASERHASGELASAIKESQQTVQNHLEQAKQICKQLESSSTASQARNQ